MSDALTLDLARAALGHCNGRGLPVRIDPRHLPKSSHKHWGMGVLVGVDGRQFVVRPTNSRHRDVVTYPEGSLHLWRSRMDPALHEVIEDLQTKVRVKETPVFNPTIDTPLDGEPPAPAVHPGVKDAMEGKAPETKPADDFGALLDQYRAMRSVLAERARTDGIRQLEKLRRDEKEAMEMVLSVRREIDQVSAQLREFGVAVPRHLAGESPAEPGPTVAWKQRLAGKYRAAVLSHLEALGNAWTSGPTLMAKLELPPTHAPLVLAPLVADGTLERTGQKNTTRYRIRK